VRVCASALACSGHVDDVGASLCGRTIIQRARGRIVELRVAAGREREREKERERERERKRESRREGGNLAGRWYAEEERAGVNGWRSSARWSISRGRLLDLQLHPRRGSFWPFAGIRSQHRLAASRRLSDDPMRARARCRYI